MRAFVVERIRRHKTCTVDTGKSRVLNDTQFTARSRQHTHSTVPLINKVVQGEKESESAHTAPKCTIHNNTLQPTCSGRASIPRHHTVNVSNHNHNTVSIKEWSRSPLSFTTTDLAQRSSPIGSLVHVLDEIVITTPPINQMMSSSFITFVLPVCRR